MYAFCLFTLMCLQLNCYLTHIKGINWQDSGNICLKWGQMTSMVIYRNYYQSYKH